MLKETLLGLSAALITFLIFLGYDITPIILFGSVGLLLYFIVDKRGGFSSSVTVPYVSQKQITFDIIGGQDTAIRELIEALDLITNMEIAEKMGIRPLKGILLTGPPGTGKTLLAKAAASYTDAVFMASSGSEFIEVYAGVGAQRVRNLFKTAKDLALKQGKKRAIIFIDEIEVLGGKRGSHTGHLEYDQTLNQLLVEMDGIKENEGVRLLIIGATNRADMLDPALMRPGRFDRFVKVDLPDKTGRKRILELHTKNKPLDQDVDLAEVAAETFGFSGAQLEGVANEAGIIAMRQNAGAINSKHIKEAIDKILLGERTNRFPSREEIFRIAIHEAGHALVSEFLKPGSVSHLTISPRGKALGYVRHIPEEDSYLFTSKQLMQQIDICLAGAIAEEIIFEDKSTGAMNDYHECVRLAKHIVFAGMSEAGIVTEDTIPKDLLNETVTRLIAQRSQEVKKKLALHNEMLSSLAAQLIKEEQVSGEDLRAFMLRAKTA
ncbi:MAG: AAA family ATPase [Bacillota bacterium]